MGIVYKHALPPWDERFTGHGLNKVQHGYHMAALGFKFMVVPGEFFATMVRDQLLLDLMNLYLWLHEQ